MNLLVVVLLCSLAMQHGRWGCCASGKDTKRESFCALPKYLFYDFKWCLGSLNLVSQNPT